MKKVKYLCLLIFASWLWAQSNSEIRPSLALSQYTSNLTIQQSGKLAGFYEEQMSVFEEQKENNKTSKVWLFFTQKIYLDENQQMMRSETVEIKFRYPMNLLSFRKTISTQGREVWYQGETNKNKIIFKNSRGVEKEIEEKNPIPEELLVRYFLTHKEKERVYKALNISTGEISDWKVTFKDPSTTKASLENPEDKKAKDYTIKLYNIEAEPITEDDEKKRFAIEYQVMVSGKEVGKVVNRGALFSMKKGSFDYSYRKIRSYTEGFSKPKDKQQLISELKDHVKDLLSSSKQDRINALVRVRKLKLWQGVPVMIEMLRDEDEEIRILAHHNLKLMTRRQFPIDVRVWRKWWVQYSRTWERMNKEKIEYN